MNELKVTYQNNGSRWLIILNGAEADIEAKFRSFWNLRATSGELEWNGTSSAQFWSFPFPTKTCKDSMWSYFYNWHALHSISHEQDREIKTRAKLIALKGGFSDKKSYHAAISKAYRRMTHLLIISRVRASFAQFKTQVTDFNVSLSVAFKEAHEYSYGESSIEASHEECLLVKNEVDKDLVIS